MGPADFAWVQTLRQAHYPPEQNRVPAHITLFHHLPPSALAEIRRRLQRICAGRAPAACWAGVLFLGKGVALRIESPGLMAMREELAEAFAGLLTPQDRAPPRLHVTIQNKAPPEEARTLARRLEGEVHRRPLVIAGLAAWHYRGGPWEQAMKAAFRG